MQLQEVSATGVDLSKLSGWIMDKIVIHELVHTVLELKLWQPDESCI